MKNLSFTLALLFAVCVAALAQKTEFKTYTTTDGLVSNNVNAITQTSDGNLWFATAGGLSSFDGTSFTNYTSDDGLADNNVGFMTPDVNGNLWFSTRWGSYGLGKFNGTDFTYFTTAEGLPSNGIDAIATDEKGWVWIGHFGEGLSVLRGDTFVTFNTQNSAICDDYISSIVVRNGKIYANGYGGCISVIENDTTFTTLDGPMPFNNGELSQISMDVYGNIWGKTYDYTTDDIYELDIENEKWIKRTPFVKDRYAPFVYCDYLGVVWTAFGTPMSGLHFYSYDSINGWTNYAGLVSGSRPNAVFMDKDYTVWFADDGAGATSLKQKFDLTGEINKRTNVGINAVLRLYKVNVDGTFEEPVESKMSGMNNSTYTFTNLPVGKYLLWGTLRTGYPDTYYEMANKWEEATPLYFGNHATAYNLYFNTLDYLNYKPIGGKKTIEGRVSRRSNAENLGGYTINVFDGETGEFLLSDKTEINGTYKFEALENNKTYELRVEVPGVKNLSTHRVTTKSDYDTYSGRDFELTEAGFEAINNATDVRAISSSKLKVFPNPAKNKVYVSSPEKGYLELYSITGELIQTKSFTGETELSLLDVNRGFYIIQLTSNKEVYTHKLLVE
jgi:hypothetical protein